MTLRWTAADMFQMGQLKNELSKIEQRALRGAPVVLTRHGKPVFALLRLDALENAVGQARRGGRQTAPREADLYERIFGRADADVASGNLVDWEAIQRRVDTAVARRRNRSRTRVQRGARKGAAR
jgi:antitoxin (DNA-binding transcriptional repressor) of toxin-antitoxin stability system